MAPKSTALSPKSGNRTNIDGSIVNIVSRELNSHTPFFEKRVVRKSPQLVLNADLPLSERRDDITETNNATVTQVGPEYRVRATTDTNSFGRLRTRQRGNYLSGSVLEPGMGIRIPTQPTGDAEIKWGYFDADNGLYFKYNSSGVFICVRRNGTEVLAVPQDEWNIDRLKGNNAPVNPSGGVFDLKDGHIFQFPFIYYGYGGLRFEIGTVNRNGSYEVIPVHQVKMEESTSINEPNLPITIEVDSGTSGVQLDCFVGGRQISPLGGNDNTARTVGAYRIGVGSIGTSFSPMVSFRHKSGLGIVPVRLSGVVIVPDVDMIVEVHRNSTLNGASFVNAPGNHVAGEIATQWDISATATYTPGETVYEDIVAGGNKGVVSTADLPKRPISELDTITLALRRVTGTNGTATAMFKVTEDW